MTNINNDLNIFKDEEGNEIYVTKKDNKVFFDLEEAKEHCNKEYFSYFYQLNTLTMYYYNEDIEDDERIDADYIDVFQWIIRNKEFLTNFLQGL